MAINRKNQEKRDEYRVQIINDHENENYRQELLLS